MSKKKKKKKSIISIIINNFILIIALFGLIYSSYKIYTGLGDYQEGSVEYDNIATNYTTHYKYERPSSKYPTFSNIDFDALLEINNDVVGWIEIPDTNIDYPILQGETNTSYIHTSIYGSYLYVGTIFMDCINSPDFSDYNTIVYGHRMKDGSMFGMLAHYLNEEGYYEKHPYVQLYTLTHKKTYQIIGMHVTNTGSNSYTRNFATKTEYKEWLDWVKEETNKELPDYDIDKNTITLSTCHGASGSTQRLCIYLQEVLSVSNDIYNQFYITRNERGDVDAILCYSPWYKHRNISDE